LYYYFRETSIKILLRVSDYLLEMTKTYPQSLAGLYKINFNDLILTPIRMVDTKPSDHVLKEIRFVEGKGIAEFNDDLFILDVKFDELTHSYTFKYRGSGHIFTIYSDFSKNVSSTTDITSFTSI
jgi:hypothetical protein